MKTLLCLLSLISSLAFAQWTDLGSSTQLIAQCPPDNYGGISYAFGGTSPSGHCAQAVMRAWSGAAMDTKRHRLIITGGGHNDYSGNEVYAISYGATKSVVRLTNPSDFTMNTGCPDVNDIDGTPVSRHTYAGLDYHPVQDTVTMFGGAPAPCGGPLSAKTYGFPLTTNTWAAKDPPNGYTPASSPTVPPACAYNPTDQLKYCIQGNTLTSYDLATNTYTLLGSAGDIATYDATSIEIDPKRNRLWVIGNGSGSPGVLRILYIDLAAGSSYTVTDVSSDTSGCDDMAVDYPGFSYYPPRGTIVGYPNNGNSVYEFNPTLLTCVEHSFSGGPAMATTAGTFGRFRYDAGLGVFVLAIATDANVFTLKLDPTPINGLGSSTVTCIDRDGDNYGSGEDCTGPDADDLDASVHTGAQLISAWGSLAAGLNHLGYAPSQICYISTTGNDGTGECDDISKPFLTYAGADASITAGTMFIYRAGTFDEDGRFEPTMNGTGGAPIVALAYPGEAVTIDTTATSASNASVIDRSYIVVDGFKMTKGLNNGCISGGTSDAAASTPDFHNNVFRHLELTVCKWGMIFAGLKDVVMEDIATHDNQASGGEHGIYIGARSNNLSSDITIQRVITYNNGYTGIQVNGNVGNLAQDQNISYGNLIAGYSWENGVHDSFFRSNLAFNWGGSGGLVISEYNGNEGLSICGMDGMTLCVCTPTPNLGSACAHDQTGNLIENFTAYGTELDSNGDRVAGAPPINVALQNRSTVCTTATCLGADLGHNIFRNIIVVTYGIANKYPPIIFNDDDKTYLATSTFENLIVKQTDMTNGTAAIGFGLDLMSFGFNPLTCAAAAMETTISGCTNVDPLFIDADPDYYNTPGMFNFRLQTSSTANGSGSTEMIPPFDIIGSGISPQLPSLGAYQGVSLGGSSLFGTQKFFGKTLTR